MVEVLLLQIPSTLQRLSSGSLRIRPLVIRTTHHVTVADSMINTACAHRPGDIEIRDLVRDLLELIVVTLLRLDDVETAQLMGIIDVTELGVVERETRVEIFVNEAQTIIVAAQVLVVMSSRMYLPQVPRVSNLIGQCRHTTSKVCLARRRAKVGCNQSHD